MLGHLDNLGGKLKPFKPIVTYAAEWEPTNGFIHYDNVFPHIAQGFRNRTVPIAIYHVMCKDLTKTIRKLIVVHFVLEKIEFRIHLGKLSLTMKPARCLQCVV